MNTPSQDSGGKSNWGLYVTVPICLVLIGYFLSASLRSEDSPVAAEVLQAAWYTPKTARGEDLANKSMVGNCFLCHAYWVGLPDPTVVRPKFVHSAIELNHGTNDRCYNCHQIDDRNKYVANDGSDLMVQIPEKLCERCHGLIYQDWLAGTHGKWTGRWDASQWHEKQTYTCTECHDPHNPGFRYEVAAPPPVWPDKYIRSEPYDVQGGTLSGLRLESNPEEIF